MTYIQREHYLNELISFKDDKIIKVVTGIRRSGKSTLLFEIYVDYLLANGVSEEQIIKVDLELKLNSHLLEEQALYDYIKSKVVNGKQNYIMIDEIQNCDGFQKVVSSLHKEGYDVYITGSNAYILSGELATYLTGRYVEIEVLPLSFKEYAEYKGVVDNSFLPLHYRDYIKYGSFPMVATYSKELSKIDTKKINTYLDGVYNSVFLKDIIQKNKISSIPMFEAVMKFVLANIGSPISAKSISDYLISEKKKVYPATVDDFLNAMVQSYIVYKVDRYDVKGREVLKSLGKYYVTDIGLRNYLLGYREMDSGHVLENVVYFELLRRGYKIFVGKVDNKEVDFVAQKQDEVIYVQVAETVKGKETLERELTPFKMIKDFHKRILITLDYDPNADYDGIKHINALDFLIGKSL